MTRLPLNTIEYIDNPQPHYPVVIEADIGRLSAEAVQSQYESAAKAVEAMGLIVKDRISRLELAMKECDSDMKLIAATAAEIIEKGKLVGMEIEHTNNVAADIRAACAEFRKKITGEAK